MSAPKTRNDDTTTDAHNRSQAHHSTRSDTSDISPDQAWVALLRAKNTRQRAFKRLVREFQTDVYNQCLYMLRSPQEAEDMAQEIFVTVYQNLNRFRGDSKLSTWIFRITRNHCLNRIKYLNRRHQKKHRSIDGVTETQMGSMDSQQSTFLRPDISVEARNTETFLKQQIAALPEDQREILILRNIQGHSYAEIGVITGLAEGTVKSRLHRARTELSKAYQEWKNQSSKGDPNE